jgi:hypothetical protein
MKIIFYDINLLNQKKYIGDIIDSFISNNKNNVVILYDEFDEEGFDYFKDKNCEVIQNKSITYNKIKKSLLYLNPELLIVNAQRLSDTAYVSVAKQLGIKTMMIQHGMYVPFLKRESFYLFKKILKTLKYFMYSQVIAKVISQNGITVFKKFTDTFIKGKIYKDAIDFTNQINVDHVLVYGEYWKKYHHDIFGYSFEQQTVIGYHELNKVDAIKSKIFEKTAVCYIAQTLVEDGRFDRGSMELFVKNLEEIAKYKKVYIKLHPRSDRTLYENKNLILLDNDIPNVGIYLGHYSSLIALVGHLQGRTILYEFDEHEIPYYFKEFAKVVRTKESLLEEVNNDISQNNSDKSLIIERYFSKSYSTDRTVALIYEQSEE